MFLLGASDPLVFSRDPIFMLPLVVFTRHLRWSQRERVDSIGAEHTRFSVVIPSVRLMNTRRVFSTAGETYHRLGFQQGLYFQKAF